MHISLTQAAACPLPCFVSRCAARKGLQPCTALSLLSLFQRIEEDRPHRRQLHIKLSDVEFKLPSRSNDPEELDVCMRGREGKAGCHMTVVAVCAHACTGARWRQPVLF